MSGTNVTPNDGEEGIKMARRLISAIFPNSCRLSFLRDDLVSIALIAYCKACESFEPIKGVSFKTYVYMRMRWAAKDFLKTELGHHIDENREEVSVNTLPDTEVPLVKYLSLKKDIEKLSADDQDLLKQYYFDDSSFEAIAKKRGCHKTTVVRQHKALIQNLQEMAAGAY